MKDLYVYPHPDDESFGVAHVISWQRRHGYEVYLLTLTKGGVTKQRFKYNYSIAEMGEVRYQEMLNVAKVLDLTWMTVLDLPDGGLKEQDPRVIERVVAAEIEKVQPQVVVTYPVHGVSGFHDHLVMHYVVKRVYVDLKDQVSYLKRLAFHTETAETAAQSPLFRLSSSTPEEIDCMSEVEPQDIETLHRALDCYVTFQETIEKSGIKQLTTRPAVFEIFQETHDPPLSDLFEKLA